MIEEEGFDSQIEKEPSPTEEHYMVARVMISLLLF